MLVEMIDLCAYEVRTFEMYYHLVMTNITMDNHHAINR